MIISRRVINRTFALTVVVALTIPPVCLARLRLHEPGPSRAASSKFDLSIDNIMRGPELVGHSPRAVRWSQDSRSVFFQWKQASAPLEKDFDTYVVNRDGTGLKMLSEDEAKEAPPSAADHSRDKTLSVFVESGDIFLYDHAKAERRQVTKTVEPESNPGFTRDQTQIYFTRSSNLFAISLDGGSLVQLTDIRPGGSGGPGTGAEAPPRARRGASEQRGTESQEYLKKEELELLDVIKRRAQKREEDEAKRKRENPRTPFHLQPRQTVTTLELTPAKRHVVATVSLAGEGTKNTIVPNYVTETAYTEDIPSRTKVGDRQTRSRLAVLSVETGEVKWVDHGQKQTPSDPATEKAAASQSKTARTDSAREEQSVSSQSETEQRDREVQLFQPIWSEDGSKAVLLASSADNKEKWILALDVETAKTRVVTSMRDEAWIGGPGAFTLGWLSDNNTIYFQSERDGYAHLYSVSYDGGEPKQLTSGRWEVTGVRLSEDKRRFFLTTSEVHPGERQLYVMPVAGGDRVRITTSPGNHQTFVSPDEKRLAIIYSYSNKPPELFIQENRPGGEATKVTSSPAPEFWQYDWIDPQIVTFKARDGETVYARLYRPANFKAGGPAVIFVHGAGYLQNVHRWWSSYYREYMFHHFLMERGYVVMDVDYRASAGYGRDWRTAIYRHMGGKDLEDQVDAARWLVSEQGVDARRIGIYGGSYGGFITLMAMFTQPDVFAAGASLRPVTDWAHYNHPYTSNILNIPHSDTEAYRRSSPIYFAEGLKGALLICHGMVDANVHFQDTVRLVQRLIELRKDNWEVAIYPIEDHGFVEATSWADEYKRIFKLFENNLRPEPARASGTKRNARPGR